MNGTTLSRRGLLRGAAGAVLAAGVGRALAGCGGSDVSVNIRRVDATAQGSQILVRASVAFTNHKNVQRTVAMHMTLNAASGEELDALDDMVTIGPAQVICYCFQVIVLGVAGSMSGATLTVTVADDVETASLGAVGSDTLPTCDYTCNY